MPHSLQSISHNHKKTHRRKHRNTYTNIQSRIGNHIPALASCNQLHCRWCKKNRKKQSKNPPGQIHEKSRLYSFGNPSSLSSSKVLTGKGSAAGRQSSARHHKQLHQTPSTYLGRNINASQRIDTALQNHASNAVNRTHHRHTKASHKHFSGKLRRCF